MGEDYIDRDVMVPRAVFAIESSAHDAVDKEKHFPGVYQAGHKGFRYHKYEIVEMELTWGGDR